MPSLFLHCSGNAITSVKHFVVSLEGRRIILTVWKHGTELPCVSFEEFAPWEDTLTR